MYLKHLTFYALQQTLCTTQDIHAKKQGLSGRYKAQTLLIEPAPPRGFLLHTRLTPASVSAWIGYSCALRRPECSRLLAV